MVSSQKIKNKFQLSGFTLIEIIIVIGIIAILSVVIIMGINPPKQLETARDNQRKAHITAIRGAIMDYFGRNGEFPSCVTEFEIDVNECSIDLVPIYLKGIPQDPSSNCSGSGYVVKKWRGDRIGVMAMCAESEGIMRSGFWPLTQVLSTVTINKTADNIIASWSSVEGAQGYVVKTYVNNLVVKEETTSNTSYIISSELINEGDLVYVMIRMEKVGDLPEEDYVKSNEIIIGQEGKQSQSSPTLPICENATENTITISSCTGCEYRKDFGIWQDSNVFTGLNPATQYPFTARKKETPTHNASEESNTTFCSTLRQDQSSPDFPVCENATENTITISSCAGCEYRRGSGSWQDSNVFTGLNPATQYPFTTRIKETPTHNASEESNTTFCSTCSLAGPPTLNTVIDSETSVTLLWTDSENETACTITGYQIQRGTDGSSWTTIIESTGNAELSYTDSGLSENTQYFYRVAAINVAGISSFSAAKSQHTGHCYATTSSCPTGYSSVLGGAQSGCATAGPITSPYPGSLNIRYRITSNNQTLTESGCNTTGTQTRTRQASISSNSGSTWSFVGSTVNCRTCARGSGCRFNGCYCTFGSCRWASRYVCYGGGYWCPSNVYLNCTTGIKCSDDHGCGGVDMWNRSCSNQSATINWCCR